ncbi:DUF1559 domain-containing protein [Mariniblastus sp.]|nr:DUF1559 domain-containing protein [Mariniblastus sp.]
MSENAQTPYRAPDIPRNRTPHSKTSVLAIVSLVLGIASLFCLIFTGIPAIILGIIAYLKTSKSNGYVKGGGLAIGGIVTGALGCLLSVVVIVPAISAVSAAAQQTETRNKIKQMGLACLNYESGHARFPSNISRENPEGGLSWRVHILPFLSEEGKQIHAQFHLDEPWDSPHNKTLIPLIPQTYQHSKIQAQLPEGHTVFQMPTSEPSEMKPAAILVEGEQGATFGSVSDGSSNTILLIETDAQSAVPWTKPMDWRFDPDNPKRNLGNHFPSGTSFGRCDGSTSVLDIKTVPDEIVKALFTRSGGEVVMDPSRY